MNFLVHNNSNSPQVKAVRVGRCVFKESKNTKNMQNNMEEHAMNLAFVLVENLPEKWTTLQGDIGQPEPWPLTSLDFYHHSHLKQTLLTIVHLRDLENVMLCWQTQKYSYANME